MESKRLENLKKDGWIVVKDFFDSEFCENLRKDCYQSTEAGLGGTDLLSNKYLNHLFLNEKLMALLTEILGEKPVYFGDSTYQIASVEGGIATGFHKDSVDRKNPNGIDWGNDYSLIRVGIYLQDHKDFSEGLVVRTNSHHTPDLKTGKKINVPSQKGDLIIWYLTTTHSGNAKRIKGTNEALLMKDNPASGLVNKVYDKILYKLLQPSQKDRVALFATFGKNDNHLERYLKYLKHRAYMVDIWKKTDYDSAILEAIKNQGKLKVREMKSEAMAINPSAFEEYNFDAFEKYNI